VHWEAAASACLGVLVVVVEDRQEEDSRHPRLDCATGYDTWLRKDLTPADAQWAASMGDCATGLQYTLVNFLCATMCESVTEACSPRCAASLVARDSNCSLAIRQQQTQVLIGV
jgi:hypothetical protein